MTIAIVSIVAPKMRSQDARVLASDVRYVKHLVHLMEQNLSKAFHFGGGRGVHCGSQAHCSREIISPSGIERQMKMSNKGSGRAAGGAREVGWKGNNFPIHYHIPIARQSRGKLVCYPLIVLTSRVSLVGKHDIPK